MPNSRKHSSKSKIGWRLWVLAVLVVAGAVFGVLQFTGVTHFFNDKPATAYNPGVPTGGQNTKGETGAPSLATHGTGTTPSSPGNPSTPINSSSTGTVTLRAPSGTFVNNHQPSLSSKTLSQMFSTCNTSPGASCEITFTNTSTGVTKTLSAQTIGSGGAVYWSWTLQELGLTQGTWKTTAIATYNGQSKTTTDAMNLEVEQ